MNKITHFRNLQGHKRPVLKLYKLLLRHSAALPFVPSKNADIRNEISTRFHANSNMMSGFHAKNLIEDAMRWARILREAIQSGGVKGDSDSLQIIQKELEKIDVIKKKNQCKKESTKQREKNYRRNPLKGSWLDEYNQAAYKIEHDKKGSVKACLYKSTSRVATNRGRALRKFSKGFQGKYKLDEVYIQAFIIPQYRSYYETKSLERRMKIETSRPLQMKLAIFKTHIGPFSYLKYPGQKIHPSIVPYMHNYRKISFREAGLTNDNAFLLAHYEDKWEELLEEKFQQPKPLGSYVTVLQQIESHDNKVRNKKIKLLNEHRKALEVKKLMLDNMLAKSFPDKIRYWKNYEPQSIHKIELWSTDGGEKTTR